MMNSNNRWASPGVDALLCISGYDQPLEDPDDEREDRKWLEKQHPRNDTVLSHVLQFCLDQGATNRTSGLIPQARWAAGKEVEPVLITLTTHSEDALRERAVEALGFRARKRNGPIEPLLQALNHKEPQTQFVAAEALARAGRAEGIQILLSSIEMMSDDRLRARAVQALGILGDERCMDVLLKLANDNEHPLQREAAEAIGHLGRSEKKDEILRLLSRLALQRNYVGARALVGLRWLNVPEGWKLIRKRAKDEDYYALEAVIPLLGYNDEPETRELVLELIRESEYDGLVESARRLFGPDSLEPDYALLESKDRYFEYDEEQKEALKRVSEKGESARMFEILGKGPSAEIQQELCNQLLICSPLPIEEAMHALESNNAQVVLVASRILGRAGQQAKSAANRVESAVQTWRQKWEVRRARMLKGGGDESELYDEGACLESLAWACGRVGDSHEELLRLLTAHSDDSLFRPIRLAALTALSSGSLPKKAHAILESLVTDNKA